MVAARETPALGAASTFDRILIIPTSSAPRPSTPGFVPQPVSQPLPQPLPEIQIEPDGPDDNPQNDIPPGAERPGNPRERQPFVPPTVNGRPVPPQPFQPDPDDDQGRPTATPSNPFGVPQGSARPGVITPAPQQPRNGPPQPDPEP
jgi:hypothetical protein